MVNPTTQIKDEPQKFNKSDTQSPTGKHFRVIARRARNAFILTLRITELASKVYEHLGPYLGG